MDGRLRYTDVMDIHGILQLIQICPSPKAEAFRVWVENIADAGIDVVDTLVTAITKAKDMVRNKAAGPLLTIRRMRYRLFGDEETFSNDIQSNDIRSDDIHSEIKWETAA